MSEWHVTECDWCKKKESSYTPDGWIEIKKGRVFDPWTDFKNKHFCKTECLAEFIHSLTKGVVV